jgi:hypothetical protein
VQIPSESQESANASQQWSRIINKSLRLISASWSSQKPKEREKKKKGKLMQHLKVITEERQGA